MPRILTLLLFATCFFTSAIAQQNDFIYSKEGKRILNRDQLIFNCLRSLHKDKTDATALSICECQVNKVDGHFTNSQYRAHTKAGIIDMNGIFKDDSIFLKQIQDCYTSSGKTALIEAEGFEDEFKRECIKNTGKDTQRNLDSNKVKNFCSCQLDMVKQKKLTDAEMATLSDPNSLLFFEMIYTCGNPFTKNDVLEKGWTEKSKEDILGPQRDTTNLLAIDGMNYVKIKMGSLTRIWLFDTGASDMLITKEIENVLKNENVISEKNYLGVGDYEMANGAVESCRKYQINDVKIGKFILNNIVVSVTEKGKRIIVGKSLMNKFASWELNNRTNKLILEQ